MGLRDDSGVGFLEQLQDIANEDAVGLKKAQESYGDSWKIRGGVGAFMMLARKFDRLEIRVKKEKWDIFEAIINDQRSEGIIDDVVDLRRYLMLVEAEMRARGFRSKHRDNDSQTSMPDSVVQAIEDHDLTGPNMIKNHCSNCMAHNYGKMGAVSRCTKDESREVPRNECQDFVPRTELLKPVKKD